MKGQVVQGIETFYPERCWLILWPSGDDAKKLPTPTKAQAEAPRHQILFCYGLLTAC